MNEMMELNELKVVIPVTILSFVSLKDDTRKLIFIVAGCSNDTVSRHFLSKINYYSRATIC